MAKVEGNKACCYHAKVPAVKKNLRDNKQTRCNNKRWGYVCPHVRLHLRQGKGAELDRFVDEVVLLNANEVEEMLQGLKRGKSAVDGGGTTCDQKSSGKLVLAVSKNVFRILQDVCRTRSRKEMPNSISQKG